MILGITEAIVTLLCLVALFTTILIVLRMCLDHNLKLVAARQSHEYQMQLLRQEREALAAEALTNARAEVAAKNQEQFASQRFLYLQVDPWVVDALFRRLK